ncbi:TlpA family protein disulfide reductase [Pedobacter sp. HDW13]|uniref:peroxiredoxin family protein n=1 Tax=Pedobacter sp. HDW13 TaxID=2714940 RepID=UPI00140A251F|nr:TlpA disulfide reductase family protein [Pedobacter sp. HDW13]QIL40391.1 TlpA family protein disulfide reductase [Pedobacter sp. HDW13]
MIVYFKRSLVAVLLLVAGTFNAKAQSSGKVSIDIVLSSALHQPGTKLKLYRDWPNRKLIDTGILDSQHQYSFKVSDSMPAVFTLSARKPFLDRTIILEKGVCTIVVNADSQTVVSGGALQSTFENYQKMIKPMEKEWTIIGNRYVKATTLDEKLQAEKENKVYAEKVQLAQVTFIKNNVNNTIGQYLTHNRINIWQDKDLKTLRDAFYPSRKTNLVSDEIEKKILESSRNLLLGMKAPLFTLPAVNGDSISLAQLLKKNKYVLVDFWASWCTPCRATNRNIAPLYTRLKNKGIEIVSVSVDENKTLWKKAIAADQIPWIQLISPLAMKSATVQDYQVKTLPATFLIDQNGVVVKQNLEVKALEQLLLK